MASSFLLVRPHAAAPADPAGRGNTLRPHPHPVSKGPLGTRVAFCHGSRPCGLKRAASPQLSKFPERVRSAVAATGRTGRSARSPRTKGRRGGQRCACRHGRAAAVRRLQRQVGVATTRNGRPVVVRLRGRQAAAAGAGVPPLHGCVFAGAGLGLRQGLELQSVVVIAGIHTPPGCLTRASAAAGSLHYSACAFRRGSVQVDWIQVRGARPGKHLETQATPLRRKRQLRRRLAPPPPAQVP